MFQNGLYLIIWSGEIVCYFLLQIWKKCYLDIVYLSKTKKNVHWMSVYWLRSITSSIHKKSVLASKFSLKCKVPSAVVLLSSAGPVLFRSWPFLGPSASSVLLSETLSFLRASHKQNPFPANPSQNHKPRRGVFPQANLCFSSCLSPLSWKVVDQP